MVCRLYRSTADSKTLQSVELLTGLTEEDWRKQLVLLFRGDLHHKGHRKGPLCVLCDFVVITGSPWNVQDVAAPHSDMLSIRATPA
jgi:hypothetical protein